MSNQPVNERIETFVTGPVTGARHRLDLFLAENLPEFSRARLQALVKGGMVMVNDAVITKPGADLEAGMRVNIRIPPPVAVNLIPEQIPLDIVFEDGNLMVINKPAGMVVHPSPGHDHGTLVHAALGHAPDLEGIGGEERPGIVHRLDKDTSGLIVIAKNDLALRWLQEQFKDRHVEKIYLALVDGHPPTPEGRIEAPIGRSIRHRKLMAVVPIEKGREAVSEYRTLESFNDHTLLEVHPLTGRTHQIRVHLAYIGCPVAGDRVYGNRKISLGLTRQFLHAQRLKITIPGEETPRQFEAKLPPELVEALRAAGSEGELDGNDRSSF